MEGYITHLFCVMLEVEPSFFFKDLLMVRVKAL